MSNIAGYGQRFIEKVPQATLILFSFVQFCLFRVKEKRNVLHARKSLKTLILPPLARLPLAH